MNKQSQCRKYQNIPGMKKTWWRKIGSRLPLLCLFCTPLSVTYADVITIGRGAGQFDIKTITESISTLEDDDFPSTTNGIVSITDSTGACMSASYTETISGTSAYRIAPGVWLVPRVTVSATFYLLSAGADSSSLSGTIGLPSTEGTLNLSSGDTRIADIPGDKEWCLALPSDIRLEPFKNRVVTANGNWIIITDGSQSSGEYRLPDMYLATFPVTSDHAKNILSSSTLLRVNTVECSVTTPQAINFGLIQRRGELYTELGSQTYDLSVDCTQTPGTASTNINLQFSGELYHGNSNRLAMNQDNIYITGEIENTALEKVTGSGSCDASTGIPFNETPIHVATMDASLGHQVFSNQVTWRLCSGGHDLPTGDVTASAQLLVTYN